jgi:hypothetical protein
MNNLRKVKYSEYIPVKYAPPTEKQFTSSHIEGTGKWQDGYPNEGVFHQWGVFPEDGFMALIERPDGTMTQIPLDRLKFEVPVSLI